MYIDILLYLKQLTNKDLLYSTGNPAQCYVAAWMGEEFGGEWKHVCVWLNPFAVDLKLSQHWLLISNEAMNFSHGMCAQPLSHVWLFCHPTACSLPDSSVHGILQARIPEWVATPFSRGFSWPWDQTHISGISCTGRQILYHWAT